MATYYLTKHRVTAEGKSKNSFLKTYQASDKMYDLLKRILLVQCFHSQWINPFFIHF